MSKLIASINLNDLRIIAQRADTEANTGRGPVPLGTIQEYLEAFNPTVMLGILAAIQSMADQLSAAGLTTPYISSVSAGRVATN